MAKVSLPANNWRYRPQQRAAWDYLNAGGLRAVLCWHRRYGKDELGLHFSAVSMVRRPATYWYMLPLKDQARTAIWEAINPHTGMRRIDEVFPSALFEKRESDMMIHCKANASTWQVKGSDNYGAGIGSPPAGIVFSEYARSNPDAWAFLRPILRENGGWAIFNSTPYGHNHFENMLRYAQSEEGRADGWFGQVLTVRDTGSMNAAEIERERRELAAERQSIEEANAIVDQEYFCDFTSAIPGVIYGKIIADMERDGRIGNIPHNPGFAVQVASDLGASEGNDMGMWWFQKIGHRYRVLRYRGQTSVGIDWFAQQMAEAVRERGFVYADTACILPHDAAHPQPSNEGAASFAQKLFKAYRYPNKVNPVTPSLAWSITRVKHFLANCDIDAKDCEAGINALRCYHRKWDAKKRAYSEKPVHDWSSNGADAFRTMVEYADHGASVPVSDNPGVQLPYPRENVAGVLGYGRAAMPTGYDDDPLGRR